MNVLVVAAHPDDELLGAGGTLARHARAGDAVHVVIVSEGASARYAAGTETVLARHARAAGDVLGVASVRLLGFPDQRLDTQPLLEITQAIEAVRDEVVPEVVYTHHVGDLNRDHRIVSEATQVACRPVGPRAPRRLLLFETPSSSEWAAPHPQSAFMPSWFVDVTDTIELKLTAMACYETEVRPPPHPRSLEALRARAATWGHTVGTGYAEAFVLVRALV